MKKTYEEPAMEVNLFEQQGDLMQGGTDNIFNQLAASGDDPNANDDGGFFSVGGWG